MSGDAVAEVVKRRASQAGVYRDGGLPIHAHLLRHAMASRWLSNGGNEGDLAELGGWTAGSSAMRGYARGNRTERMKEAFRRQHGEAPA